MRYVDYNDWRMKFLESKIWPPDWTTNNTREIWIQGEDMVSVTGVHWAAYDTVRYVVGPNYIKRFEYYVRG